MATEALVDAAPRRMAGRPLAADATGDGALGMGETLVLFRNERLVRDLSAHYLVGHEIRRLTRPLAVAFGRSLTAGRGRRALGGVSAFVLGFAPALIVGLAELRRQRFHGR